MSGVGCSAAQTPQPANTLWAPGVEQVTDAHTATVCLPITIGD